MGFLLVDVFLMDWKQNPAKGITWDIISGLCWLGLVPVLWFHFYREFAVPALILLAYIGAFRGRTLSWLMSRRLPVICGGMCYTLYLYHGRVVYAIMPGLVHLPKTGLLAIDVAVFALIAYVPILVVCALLFVAIEKPCMQPHWPARIRDRILRVSARRQLAADADNA